jgi:heme/copper-type cytochrome/quinol oxidase subunit 4
MINFILTIIALLIQMYSIYLAKKNDESKLRYSFWFNILSVIIGIVSLYYYLIGFFSISNILPIPKIA